MSPWERPQVPESWHKVHGVLIWHESGQRRTRPERAQHSPEPTRPSRRLPAKPSRLPATAYPYGPSEAPTVQSEPMADPPLPDLILYGRPNCGLCDEARALVQALLTDRRAHNLPTPTLVERDIDTDPAWQRAYFAAIPVVELGDRRVETLTSLGALRRLIEDVLDRERSTA